MSSKSIPPHTPFLYSKAGVKGVYLFFLLFIQNIDCGYLLVPPQRGVPTMYVLSKNVKNFKFYLMQFSIFTSEKNLCLLHGNV